MKNLSYSNLKEKVKKANKKEFIALLAILWWIPGGSLWCTFAIWIRYSIRIKNFFGIKQKNL
tara:strand:- start:2422 stop:2607 length:186 start_codon:yes stop_codon:yes gene_type:complete